MKAWIYDDLPGDQRKLHNEGDSTPVDIDVLETLGVIPKVGIDEAEVEAIAKERSYKNRDQISVSKAGLGDLYETKLESFFRQHLHEDEEIRYIREGSGFFDVRDGEDKRWIRIKVEPKDLLILPAGIYHRFTLDEGNFVKADRLFQDEPKWVPLDRSEETDKNEFRAQYLQQISATA